MPKPDPTVTPEFVKPRPRSKKDDYRFGDIIEAYWLVALYLADDAKLVHVQGMKPNGAQVAYLRDLKDLPLKPDGSKNLIQAHADEISQYLVSGHAWDNLRRAMIVSDDCEISHSNRILVVPVLALPVNLDEREDVLTNESFGRYAVNDQQEPEGKGFKCDFSQAYTVALESICKTEVVLEPADLAVRQKILIRWTAHATRHGPRAAQDGLDKLARLIESDGDPVEIQRLKQKGAKPSGESTDIIAPVRETLAFAWSLEGVSLDNIARDWEQELPPQKSITQVIDTLEAIVKSAQEAQSNLESLRRSKSEPPE